MAWTHEDSMKNLQEYQKMLNEEKSKQIELNKNIVERQRNMLKEFSERLGELKEYM